jgi:hypothetical protein
MHGIIIRPQDTDDANIVYDLGISKDALSANGRNFVKTWLIRTLQIELEKINFEDDPIDRSQEPYLEARKALEALKHSDEWLHPLLCRFVEKYKATENAEEIEYENRVYEIPANGHLGAPIDARIAKSDERLLQVSNLRTNYVPIIEETLANPVHCSKLEAAMIERLTQIVQEHQVTHLCFIEKELGPVGALLMFSAAVSATGKPGVIYRETHWPKRAALSGAIPGKDARIAIVYDLMVSGAGICHAASALRNLTGACTVAALVLFRYTDEPRSITCDHQTIHIESLARPAIINRLMRGGASNTVETLERFDSEEASPDSEVAESGDKLDSQSGASIADSSIEEMQMGDENQDEYDRLWSYPSVVQVSDFNKVPLNGEKPEEIKKKFKVDVEILGKNDGLKNASTVRVAGATSNVRSFLQHLQSSWPK